MKVSFKILTCVLVFISTNLSAQNVRFLSEGVIEFERSTNIYAILDKRLAGNNSNYMEQAYEQFKKSTPQFKHAKSLLYFSKNKTVFQPVENEVASNTYLADDPAVNQINVIYSDLTTQEQIVQKKVYEQTFLVKDSLKKINWKITDERRDIAGYSCRRANALIMDSIYVVAFYTDEIMVSGGPESFNGLPGMILGIALPHENVTWFAKTVTDTTVESKIIAPPTKGKKVDKNGLITTLKEALKDWGTNINTALKIYLM